MHKPFAILLSVISAATAFAQGQVNFNNYVPAATPPVNAPVTLHHWGGPGAGSIPGLKAQLFLVGAGHTRTAVGDVATFRTSPAAAQYYINGFTVVIPGIDAGGSATFVMRAWDGATYEASLRYGESAPVTITLGGGTSVPADLTGLKSFDVGPMPEPSFLALGLLGGAIFLLWRRHQASR